MWKFADASIYEDYCRKLSYWLEDVEFDDVCGDGNSFGIV